MTDCWGLILLDLFVTSFPIIVLITATILGIIFLKIIIEILNRR